jgi:CheY-like chemotaxis protein
MSTDTGALNLLLIDDNEDDRVLFATALQETGLKAELFQATDGYAGLGYIFGHGPYTNREKFPLPDLVFLDVKMPGIDGFGVLRQIRGDPSTKRLPVIVLSNSEVLSDMKQAYALGADAFHKKPARYVELVTLLSSVITPWQHTLSQAPHRKRRHLEIGR